MTENDENQYQQAVYFESDRLATFDISNFILGMIAEFCVLKEKIPSGR